jgi:hypothetical protein
MLEQEPHASKLPGMTPDSVVARVPIQGLFS